MSYKFYLLALVLLLSFVSSSVAQKTVRIEDVWQYYRFYPQTVRGVNWTKDGQYYTSQTGKAILKYDINTRKVVDTLYGKATHPKIEFDDYELSQAEDKILLSNQTESIYRRSTKAFYYVFDLKNGKLTKIYDQNADWDTRISHCTLSPDGSKVAFVFNNNLYWSSLDNPSKVIAITQNGKKNEIINGMADWVYEEEFSFTKAFQWSPDSKRIAFYTFDESQVREYNMQMWEGLYPQDYRFKYPKAGEANSKVKISIYFLENQTNLVIDLGKETDMYIPRINWTQNPEVLSIRRLNRLQNTLEILHADVGYMKTGKPELVLTEKSNTYIDLDFTDDLTYLADNKTFLHTSERDGYKHIYLYDLKGKLIRQVTKGNWEVSSIVGIDEKRKLIYYTSTEVSPLERHLYVIDFEGKNKKQLTTQKGVHRPNFSPDCKFYLDYYSSASQVPQVILYQTNPQKELAILERNEKLQNTLKEYKISPKEFFEFKTEDGTTLHGWLIKPLDMQAGKKYPVLMFVYGGPGSQQTENEWDSFNFFWYQHLASKGFAVACIDNRGTGGKGEAFKKITYANLGKYEVQDQISGAKYLATLPFIDKDRIGIWGWSYGGYMSSLCILLGNEVFKVAIAVAPVTNWRFYDTIYTERYLKLPQDNSNGYDDFSPITHASKLKGKYLLIHGTGDDNVHFQNAVEMQNALIKANKQFDSFYYPNRNHSISGGNTRLHLYQMMTNFLEKNL
ncbi:MAG: S9 family peptidase [Microscillaceae bacterium]|nr:S9 family peptidase [Microscillaceae bacterium]MDW8460392.1 S9 family peptidase [Cytophagales bacterium]